MIGAARRSVRMASRRGCRFGRIKRYDRLAYAAPALLPARRTQLASFDSPTSSAVGIDELFDGTAFSRTDDDETTPFTTAPYGVFDPS